jgi:hypothetical protein
MLRRYCFAAVVFLFFIEGCSKSLPAARELHPVKGKVVWADGSPVRWAIIRIEPLDPAIGNEATGTIRQDGTFGIATYSRSGNDGAVAGEYKVTIERYQGPEAKPQDVAQIPHKYSEASTSGLTLKIEPGENTPTITLN